jgi:hypothetical protein
VTPTEELPDLIYIEVPPPTSMESICSALPLAGATWYPRPVVQFCLYTGRVAWVDLLYGITATTRYPRKKIREALSSMDAAWADVWPQVGLDTEQLRRMQKDTVNAMVGYFGMGPGTEPRGVISYDVADFDRGQIHPHAFGVPGLFEAIWERKCPPDSGTYRPIYDFCVGTERVRLAIALYALRQVETMGRASLAPKHLTVDGCIAPRPRKKATMDRIESVICGMPFRALSDPRGHVLAVLRPDKKQKRLDSNIFALPEHDSDETVYKITTPNANQLIRGLPEMSRVAPSCSYVHATQSWTTVSEEQAAREGVGRRITIGSGHRGNWEVVFHPQGFVTGFRIAG